jgi:hypothetical protein
MIERSRPGIRFIERPRSVSGDSENFEVNFFRKDPGTGIQHRRVRERSISEDRLLLLKCNDGSREIPTPTTLPGGEFRSPGKNKLDSIQLTYVKFIKIIPAFTNHVNLPLLGGGVMGCALGGVGF